MTDTHPQAESDQTSAPLSLLDLETALNQTIARDGAILTAGELRILASWFSASTPARALFARLLLRQDRLIPLADLRYQEVPEPTLAANELFERGLAWSGEDDLPPSWLLEAHTVESLRGICRLRGVTLIGTRKVLAARVLAALGVTALRLPALRLRHRGLFRRLCGFYLLDREGDLNRLVLDRIGVQRAPSYAPSTGPGIFPDRRSFLASESAHLWLRTLETRFSPSEPGSHAIYQEIAEATKRLKASRQSSLVAGRFEERRYLIEGLVWLADRLEKLDAPHLALETYRSLHGYPISNLSLRVGRCLEHLGRPQEALTAYEQGRNATEGPERLALERSGSRLSRALRVGWSPLPPLREPSRRKLTLTQTGTRKQGRPLWESPSGPQVIESAVAEVIRAAGRNTMEAENGPWRTLFGILFFEAIFAPVHGALPAPLLSRPIDLGTPNFKLRRENWIQPILEEIRQGHACTRLKSLWGRHYGEGIAGVDWQRHELDQLLALCEGVGGPALSSIMNVFCEDWRGAGSGLPDLVVLRGPTTRLPGLFPGKIPEELLLVEIKGPTDSLRDEQRVWLDRLLLHGVRVEVWDVDGPETTPQRPG